MQKVIMRWLVVVLVLAMPLCVFAVDGVVKGKITDAETGEALPGANVTIKGTSLGAAANIVGDFEIVKVPVGSYELVVTYMGYADKTIEAAIASGTATTVNVELEPKAISAATITILADRAKVRETPVAFSNLEKTEIQARLASQDIPMVLNTTPSVYATQQGGGAGDARINIRGFDQRNIAIMINGVPVNDMENGWVYWSNWDGVADATSSIQMQRGLTAVNLATPAIGGAMNIITDPTSTASGVFLKQEYGSGDFLKTTASFGTGLIDDKFAVNGTLVKKIGDGVIDKTWTDAYAYYLGASYAINKDNRIELYAVGAPQRHGQNLYKQNIAAYSHDLAKDMDGYTSAWTDAIGESESGQLFNENWAPINGEYAGMGQQWWNGKAHNRYSTDFINERENFFHKPIINLNWYSNLSPKMNLFTTVYWSGGEGGGTGTYGDFLWDYASEPTRIADWDGNFAINKGTETRKGAAKEAGQSMGILRNSVNNQWTVGAIAKVAYKASDELTFNVGVDWRKARIFHFREVRDLLGGSYFYDDSDDFRDPNEKLGLGDKIAYNFTNDVNWIGGFAQGEYTNGRISAYGTVGVSGITYTHNNHFIMAEDGNELEVESDMITGFQVKGGANYRITEKMDAFVNAGYVSKVPIFDNVIDDGDGTMTEDPVNETFLNIEAGLNYLSGNYNVKLNAYHTIWNDRSRTRGYTNPDGREVLVFLTGLDAVHQGVELEAAVRPINMLNISAVAGIGNWKYTDDVSGQVKDYDTDTFESYNYYVKDLKVGDQPQTIVGLGVDLFPVKGLYLRAEGRYYMDHFAAFDPFSRTDSEDRGQSWEAPAYGLVDLHAYYTIPVSIGGVKVKLFGHLLNALDALYIQDAVDNSSYNAYSDNGKNHSADDAEVFVGMPRFFNVGLELTF